MRTHTEELPSGLVVTQREFKVKDEDLLSNRKLVKSGKAETKLLEAITHAIEDPGPYRVKENGSIDWDEVLTGDRFVALLKNRIYTWGEFLEFSYVCPRCRQGSRMTINLNDLEIKPLCDDGKNHVANGTPLVATFPRCGNTIKYRLGRGKDKPRLMRIQKEHKASMASSFLRLFTIEVEGVKQPDLKNFFSDLSAMDSSFLRAEMERNDCGVEQEIEFDCDECSHVWRADVSLGGENDFLFPKFRS